MKKFMMMVCSAALLLSLVGCGKADSQKSNSDDVKEKKPTTTQSETMADNRTDSGIPGQPEEDSRPTVETQPEEQWKPAFESDRLSVYTDRFHEDDIKALHTAMFGDLYVELEDGFYEASDEEKSNRVDESIMTDWSYSQFTDFIYVDNNGYYHVTYRGKEYLAHGIKGEIFYCYANSDLVIYSMDEDGYVYFSKFDKTGKKLKDNEIIRFEVEVNGEDVLYDRVDSLQVLPAKGSYISAPYILVYIDGIGYVQDFYFVFHNEFSVNNRVFLTSQETYMDHSNSNTTFDYVTQGVEDKISYIYNDDEYVIHLPDGHTVDEIKYFNRGVEPSDYNYNMSRYDILVFDNGDVYFWDDDPSILGETPIKDEELSQIGAEIQEVVFANTDGYYFLMSDGVIYEVCQKS